MGIVRALVVIVIIAVAASPLVSGRFGTSSDVPAVYAESFSIVVRDKQERDKEKKDKNSSSDEDDKGRRIKTE